VFIEVIKVKMFINLPLIPTLASFCQFENLGKKYSKMWKLLECAIVELRD
jgi:IS5 family transposase